MSIPCGRAMTLYAISLSAMLQRNQRGGILMVLFLNGIGSKVAGLLGVMAIREREEMKVWAGLRGPSRQVAVAHPPLMTMNL